MQDFSLGKDQSRKSKNIVTWTFFRIQVESFLQKQKFTNSYIYWIYIEGNLNLWLIKGIDYLTTKFWLKYKPLMKSKSLLICINPSLLTGLLSLETISGYSWGDGCLSQTTTILKMINLIPNSQANPSQSFSHSFFF